MDVTTKKIVSASSPDDDRPWYDLSVNNGDLIIDTDGDGGHAPDLTGDSIAIDTSQNSVVAIEQGGGLITFALGDLAPPLRAHLAWYDASADTVQILEFVEE